MSANLLCFLPEYVLTIVGVIIMLAEPTIPAERSRKPLGWLAILGTLGAGAATWYQKHLVSAGGPITGFYGTVQVDALSIFFHLLIAAVVLVVLLAWLD